MNTATKNTSPHGPDPSEWDRIAASREFKNLVALKKLFIIPAFVFFFVFYFSLLVLVGYAPEWMSIRIFRTVNLAYLFALSQFLVGWLIAWLYMKASAKFDRLTNGILREVDGDKIFISYDKSVINKQQGGR